MSEKLIRNLHELTDSIQENSASVEKQLSSRKTVDHAVVISAAKYRRALELLADE
jgi:hypothetical protein